MIISNQNILIFQKLSGPLGLSGLKSLHGFVTLGGGRMAPNCLPCVLLGHRVVGSSRLENLYRKPYREWSTAVKTFKKTSKWGHTKRVKYYLLDF